jgi:aminoglycoside phosphotransferase (APT) family kinase protein
MDVQPLLAHLFPGKETPHARIRTGKHNESYFVTVDSTEYVLRIAPPADTPVLFYERGMMRREPAIHELVTAHTRAPVARILEHDFTGSVIPNDWMLMERLPGAPISDSPLGGAAAHAMFYELGRSLREVHEITNSWHGYPRGSDTGPEKPRWLDAFTDMWDRLLDDVVSTEIYTADDKEWLIGLLRNHESSFGHDPLPSLLHMDVWSQNILSGPRGKLLGIVDWDRGLWGDPEIEFSVLEYCGMDTDAFWKGYGGTPERSDDYQVRRVFYLLYEHQKYIFIRAMRGGDIASARRYAQQSLGMARELT